MFQDRRRRRFQKSADRRASDTSGAYSEYQGNGSGDYTGDIIGDLNTKRARVSGMNPQGDVNVIEAQVPLSEIMRYAIDLKSMTQGRGYFTVEFNHYEEVPSNITQKIVAEHEAEKQKVAE